MSNKVDALYAITIKADRIVRVVQAPHQLGWTAADYQIWACQLTYAWGECFGRRQELVLFSSGADLDDVYCKLKADGLENLEAFDHPELVDFDEFNDIVGGKTL